VDLSTLKKRALWQIDAVGAAVFVAASLGAYFGVLGPLMAQRSFLESCRQKLTIQSEKAEVIKASMSQLTNRLTIAQKELAASEIKLKTASRINQHVADITTFLGDCELKVDQVQIGPPLRDPAPREPSGNSGKTLVGLRCDLIPISISGKGGYKQCAAFLHQVCRTFPDICVAEFELQGNPAKPGQPGTFRFELFWLAISETRRPESRKVS